MGLPHGQLHRLIDNVNLAGSASRTTGLIDLRRKSSVVLFSRGASVASQPDYTIDYAEGLALEFGQNSEDAFEAFQQVLTTTGTGNENWIITPVPRLFLTQAIKFKLTALGGSPSDSLFTLFAWVVDREAAG